MHVINYGNPFGDQFSLELDDWPDLYKTICNVTSNTRRRRSSLSETHKLSIALQMRGEHPKMYKFRPQHKISDNVCMVLQKRAFRLDKSGHAVPLSFDEFHPKDSQHVLVRELAFGPDSDRSVRSVALWFNIPESEVEEWTPQQAKRYRYKKKATPVSELADLKPSTFDGRECFVMIRPHDSDAFQFATEILQHRFKSLQAERLAPMSERSEALAQLRNEKNLLREKFNNHRRHWAKWAWPMTMGRQVVDEDTPIPQVEREYRPKVDHNDSIRFEYGDSPSITHGSAVLSLWDTFTKLDFRGCEDEVTLKDLQLVNRPGREYRRLPIFAKLGYGEAISPNRSLPHITGTYTEAKPLSHRQSERCWRALLLREKSKHQCQNEWEIVYDHFQRSRSQKTLAIVQQ